jgi:hypothetical protein
MFAEKSEALISAVRAFIFNSLYSAACSYSSAFTDDVYATENDNGNSKPGYFVGKFIKEKIANADCPDDA